jgi:trans-2-enoyl-CoA reductase
MLRGLIFGKSTLTICRRCISTRQLVYKEYGDPEKILHLETTELEAKALKDNEVFVKWRAAPINPADINQLQGVYAVKPPLPAVGGNEGCGTVEAVGPKVDGLQVGDLVIPNQSGLGTWRLHGIHNERNLFRIDANIPVTAAATFQVNPPTAYRMLKDFVQLNSGDTIVQNGANSAVGRYVIQICRLRGLNSINVVRSRPNIEELKTELTQLGASEVYTEEEFVKVSRGLKNVRLGLNCVSGRSSLVLARSLADGGYLVTYGGMSKQPVQTPTGSFIFNDITLKGFWMSRWYDLSQNKEERTNMYAEIGDWYIKDKLKTPHFVEHSIEKYGDAISSAVNASNCKHIFKFE